VANASAKETGVMPWAEGGVGGGVDRGSEPGVGGRDASKSYGNASSIASPASIGTVANVSAATSRGSGDGGGGGGGGGGSVAAE
jgi:hypothetical protein